MAWWLANCTSAGHLDGAGALLSLRRLALCALPRHARGDSADRFTHFGKPKLLISDDRLLTASFQPSKSPFRKS